MESKLTAAEEREKIMRGIPEGCFTFLLADLAEDRARLLKPEGSKTEAALILKGAGNLYEKFIIAYLERYTDEEGKSKYAKELSAENIRERLKKEREFSVCCKHIRMDGYKPAEINISACGDADGDKCTIAIRFTDKAVKTSGQHDRNLVNALVRYYHSIYYIDLDSDTFNIIRTQNIVSDEIYEDPAFSHPYTKTMNKFTEMFISDESKEMFSKYTSIDYIKKRLEETESYSLRYSVNPQNGMEFFELRIVKTEDEDDERHAFMTVRNIDSEVAAEHAYQHEIERKNTELKRLLEKEKMYQTELKNALDSAKAANQVKADFLSKMSHDMRTPMNAIIGMTAIAGAHLDDVRRTKECLAKISSSGHHLLGIINDVLDMARIETGQMIIKEEVFSLSDLAAEIIEKINPLIKAKKHDLKVYIHDIRHENVIGDYSRLRQALYNIIENAALYTPDGGKITLSVRQLQNRARHKTGSYEFIITDNGVGMSEEILERIYEPFERGEDLRISKIQGTGLGMPITKSIIRMSGGTIDIKSSIGEGTSVTVVMAFKLYETDETDVSELAGLSVLVAGDDKIICENTCRLLREIGMKSEHIADGKDVPARIAERCSRGEEYFAVIMDWEMNGTDSTEITRRIHSEANGNVPVIIISAYDWSDIALDAKAAGAAAFISAPIFKSSLINVFKSIIDPDPASLETDDLNILRERDYSSKHVLIAEDNALNREIAAELIGTMGAAVHEAEDGKQAVEMVKAAPDDFYDIIFMDIQMPNMNGYDAAAAIRHISDKPYCRDIPIIAMTANAFDEDILAAYEAGMNEHMSKPIDISGLNEIMKKWADAK